MSASALVASAPTGTELGLWLAAVGALVVVCVTFLTLPSRGVGGMRFGSSEAARFERLQHAAQSVALAFIAAGSAIVAIAELPAAWVVALSLAVFAGLVWLVGAYTQHRVWVTQHEDAKRAVGADAAGANLSAQRRLACAEYCIRWRWALRHPFNGQTWPEDLRRRHTPPTIG